MLSIGKLALGQQEYYLGQVAAGLEDYYTGSGEAPGRWLASAAQLGLEGEVDADQLRALLAGMDPTGTYRLSARAHRVAGFDLTFSAPKSVSVLWALGDPGVALAVRDAHERAVEAALGFVEREGAWTRRGFGGSEAVRTAGFVAAGFAHRVSRNGDPQLHTHVLVANVVLGEDGRWGSVDARRIYAHRIAAGYLYQAQLRHELTRTLGVAWMAPHRGAAEIAGVPARLLRALSSRRAEIEEHLAAAGTDGAAAAQRAALATRRRKQDLDLGVEQQRWRELAVEHGFGPEQLRRVLGVGRPLDLTRRHAELIVEDLLGPGGLTARAAMFDRAGVVRAVAELAPTGLTARRIERFADALLRHPEIVQLPTGRFSTRELVAVETRALTTALSRVRERDDAIAKPYVRRVLDRYPSLEAEQTAMVLQLTMAGNGVDVVVAPAGTGKTYALGVARDIWTTSGRRVRGVALAGRAAVELEESARIPSSTIDSFLRNLKQKPLQGRDVLVVDEAGMVGTRTLAALIDHAAGARAKIVLVGDYHQLPAIEAGGLLRSLAERLPVIELETNRRQREAWERDALIELRNGDITQALRAYVDHDRVHLAPNADTARQQTVESWLADYRAGERALMVAARHDDVAALNRLARQELADAGHIAGPGVSCPTGIFQPGDRVVANRNDYQLDIRNGQTATVIYADVDTRSLLVQLDNQQLREIPAGYLDERCLGHGYAVTIHKAQGLTVDHAHLYAGGDIDRELTYVAMSRGRASNHLHLPDPTPRDDAHALEHAPDAALVALARRLEIDHRQEMAIEIGRCRPETRGVQNARSDQRRRPCEGVP